jgi:hypothetical protein
VVKAPYEGDIPGLRLAIVADVEGNSMELGQHTH